MSQPYRHAVSYRYRSLRLHVNSDGELCVTSPPFTPKWLIERFIANNQTWIAKAQQKNQQRSKLQSDDFVYLFGSKYTVINQSNATGRPGFTISDHQLLFSPIDAARLTPTATQLNRFLKSTAESYLIPRTSQLADKMSLCYKRISLKQQSSRWGSCSSQGNLNFNWRLIHFHPDVIDYVIIHELAHLQHQNHSAQFWQLVALYDPLYKNHRRTLKQHYW